MKAAILEKIGAPLTVADVDLGQFHHANGSDRLLEEGQVLVKVLCSGICGSQLQEIDGIKGDSAHLPHLLGHEGCGIVMETGLGVRTVKKGDKVIAHWRKGAGIEAAPAVYGNIKAGPITTFSEYAIVSENRVTAIPHDIPNDFAALLGCALSTALSVIENEVKPRIGDVISVIGCGGLGLSLIFALTMRKSELWMVYGIDQVESKKGLVEQFYPARFATKAPGSDVIIGTVGNRPLRYARYISLQKNGTSGGGFNPSTDIPRYCEQFRHGTFNGYENLITHRISLDQINDGIQLMREGKAGRVLIEMNHDG